MPIQVFILSKLMEDNNYPYKLKKQLSDPIPFDQLGGLTESKLYYHFDSLVKQGLIEIVEIIKEEHRPDKQVFGITPKGREELPKKIYKLFENASSISDMVVGLAYLKYADRDKVVEILKNNKRKFLAKWEQIADFEKQMKMKKDQDKEKLVEYLGEYFSSRADHTIHWLDEVIKRIQQGEI
ncbi:PadR family transcriptional regulator [Peribacillus sp. NPDC097295]|uniref:PadR family transcriptional regulator n=1 Tax=Peribacillus sp. NPDC097295 TaxID=3364402 RepID=UPI00380BF560